jgi:hypothetical protein
MLYKEARCKKCFNICEITHESFKNFIRKETIYQLKIMLNVIFNINKFVAFTNNKMQDEKTKYDTVYCKRCQSFSMVKHVKQTDKKIYK